jgi:hypothetical protein
VARKKIDLLVDKMVHDAQFHSQKLTTDMEYIKNYGNITYRKKHKLKQIEADICRNNIYGKQIKLSIMSIIISGNNRLFKKYEKFLQLVNKRLEETLNGMEAIENGRKK